jgi:hypothetical protein
LLTTKGKQEENSSIFEEIKLKPTKSNDDITSPNKQIPRASLNTGSDQISTPTKTIETDSPRKPILSITKQPSWAMKNTSSKLPSRPSLGGGDDLITRFQSVKLTLEDSRTYVTALTKEGFDSIDKLSLLDEDDLKACGITKRFDVKAILSLKNI